MNKIKIIFAMGANHAFGLNNGLPWEHNKEDLRNFVRETKGTDLLMGSNTFKSLPNKLKDRKHIVVSTNDDIRCKSGERPDVIFTGSVVNAIIEANKYNDVSVIGGIGVISDAIGIADEIILTTFREEFQYDVKVPNELLEAIDKLYDWDYYSYDKYPDFFIKEYKRKK